MRYCTIVFLLLFVPLTGVCQSLETLLFSGSTGTGAKALGMGGAFIALADDPTASFWNPAGLANLDKPETLLALKADTSIRSDLAPSRFFYDAGPDYQVSVDYGEFSTTRTGKGFDFASVSYPVKAGGWKLVPQFSYQRILTGLDRRSNGPALDHAVYILGTETESYDTQSNLRGDSSGGVDVWSTSLGFNFGPRWNFGFGLNWWRSGASGGFTYDSVTTEGDDLEEELSYTVLVNSGVKVSGFNMNLGALFKPTKNIQLGVVYKTPFTLDHTLDYSREESVSNGIEATYVANESGKIDFPATLGLGFAFHPKERWTLTADYVWTNWSSAKYDFHEVSTLTYLGVTLEEEESGSLLWPSYHDPSEPVSGLNQKQQDSAQIRFGTEYVLRWKTEIPLRAGFFTDRLLISDATGNNITFKGWTIGTGIYWSKLLVDLAYVHEGGGYRGQDFDRVTSDFTESLIASKNDQIFANTFYASTRLRF